MLRRVIPWVVLLVGCDGSTAVDAGVERDAAPLTDAGVDGGGEPVRPTLGVYSEFLAPDAVEATLPALAARSATLQVAVPSTAIGDASLLGLLRAAEAASVDVRLWLLLPQADGYWPNEANLDVFFGEVTRLLDWIEGEGAVAAGVVYDLEPAFEYSEALRVGFAEGSLEGLQSLMRSHLDPVAFAASRDQLAAHVREVQARGYRAEAVTYPQVVDDMADGDADLQDALDIPVDGVPFDDVAFMVYQTVFAEARGAWVGPGLIRSYGVDARAHFGDRATLALGLVGTASVVELDAPPYDAPAQLAGDVAAALGAGITRVEVYSLDGMVELDAVEAWLGATEAVPGTPSIEPEARVVRGAALIPARRISSRCGARGLARPCRAASRSRAARAARRPRAPRA
ncbi:MAG: hypothetical protein H6719_26895 [Sandaracinaceae bacterium]|nr:hypothetical protein [Sandaracinaceae bacterium]